MKISIASTGFLPYDAPWPVVAAALESASVVAVAVAVHDRCVVRTARMMTARRRGAR